MNNGGNDCQRISRRAALSGAALALGAVAAATVAAGIVGGAIGTAGAIAAAPFGAGPYAYYNDPYAYAYP